MLVPLLATPFHGLPNSGDYLLRPGFNLCVHLCHGKYLNILGKTAILQFTCSIMLQSKITLCPFEDRRYLLDAINSLTYGHYVLGCLTNCLNVAEECAHEV